MLGDRRNNSLFADRAASSASQTEPEQTVVHDIPFEEQTGRAIFAENATTPKASDLFFAPQAKGRPFGAFT